jgi:hypothetical protein
METQIDASKNMCKIDDKNQIKTQFIFSQSFHRTLGGRVREITAGEQFEPRTLKSFDPLTQESHRASPATITSPNRVGRSDQRQRKKWN